MSPRTLLVFQSVLLGILGSPSGATAQGDHLEEGLRPRVRGAIDFLIARPLGEFADLVGYGAGWSLHLGLANPW